MSPLSLDVRGAIAEASRQTGVSAKEILFEAPSLRVTQARWIAWKALRQAGYGPRQIAGAWGCDHASIINAEGRGWAPRRRGPARSLALSGPIT